MAQRFAAAGHSLAGFDVDPARRDAFAALGGEVLASAQEGAARARRIVLSLPHSVIAASVIDEMAPALQAGDIILDTTTGDPEDAVRFATNLAARGVRYLDATVGGSS